MELLLLVVTAAMVGMLIASLGRDARGASPYTPAPKPDPTPTRLPKPVPAGHQVYESYLTVACTEVYLAEALAFAQHREQALRLQRESVSHDPNAIKVIGVTMEREYPLGYVPQDVARKLISTGLLNQVAPRLVNVVVGYTRVNVDFQLVGPASARNAYEGSAR